MTRKRLLVYYLHADDAGKILTLRPDLPTQVILISTPDFTRSLAVVGCMAEDPQERYLVGIQLTTKETLDLMGLHHDRLLQAVARLTQMTERWAQHDHSPDHH